MLVRYKPTVPVLNRRLAVEWGVVMAVPFCERDGAVTREYHQGRNLAVEGGAVWQGQSLAFDQSDDYVECGTEYNPYTLGAITILVHCTLGDVAPAGQAIVARHRTADSRRSLNFGLGDAGGGTENNLNVVTSSNGNNPVNTTGATNLSLGQTIRAAAVFEPSRFTSIWLDGERDAHRTSGNSSSLYDNGLSIRIGARSHTGDVPWVMFKGTIYSVAICNRALSESQIRQWTDDSMIFFKPDPPHVFYSFPKRPSLVFRRFV